jgi:hypothetical protein
VQQYEGDCAVGNGIVRAARVSKRLYGWHDQPLAYGTVKKS